MNIFEQIKSNQILMVAMLSWFIAQLIKLVITFINEKRLDFQKLMSSGGMPSSHSSFTVALAVGVGQLYGYETPLFAIATVFSFVVMYDAANVRLEAGKQAAVLNKIISNMQDSHLKFEDTLKELLGHTPVQVLVGAILGIIVAVVCIP